MIKGRTLNIEWAKLYATIACLRSPPVNEELPNVEDVIAFLAAAISDDHFQSLDRDGRWQALEGVVKERWHSLFWAIRPLLHKMPAVTSEQAVSDYLLVEEEFKRYKEQLKNGEGVTKPDQEWQRVVLQAAQTCISYGEQVVGLRQKLVNQEWE